jgi:hypothetical protein
MDGRRNPIHDNADAGMPCHDVRQFLRLGRLANQVAPYLAAETVCKIGNESIAYGLVNACKIVIELG